MIFLTNNMALPALTICALYKGRWQVELFFKWIKQHLRIKYLLGNSENALKTQVWCAVATCVLIAIVRKELQIEASPYTCQQILSVSVFEKPRLLCAFQADEPTTTDLAGDAMQLILFNFQPDSSDLYWFDLGIFFSTGRSQNFRTSGHI